MLTIRIDSLEPFHSHLHGGSIGETHAQQVRNIISQHHEQQNDALQSALSDLDPVVEYDRQEGVPEPLILDFKGVKGTTASYLRRLINPFFLPRNSPDGFPREFAPILINVEPADLAEEIDDFLAGKGRALIIADCKTNPPKFRKLLGQLTGAAAETFQELQVMKRATAVQLYDRHRTETTNQTVWNHRLLQLVDLRVARRSREGRFWIYEPTVQL